MAHPQQSRAETQPATAEAQPDHVEKTTVVRRTGPPPQSPVPTYVGIALVAIGFVLIGLAWDGASRLDFIQGQFPYFISGGLTGLGLIIVGVTMMVLETVKRDALQRRTQLQRLTSTLARLHGELTPPDPFDPAVTGEYRPKPRAGANGQSEAVTEQLPAVSGDLSWDAGS